MFFVHSDPPKEISLVGIMNELKFTVLRSFEEIL